jgi:four helix bundle protein
MEKKYLTLNQIESFKVSFRLSNIIWDEIIKWDYFAKDTIGKQFANASDSISANIAEGFGRYNKKDKIKFYRYSRGSVLECLNWNEKARKRGLLSEEKYQAIFNDLNGLPKMINSLIKFTNDNLTE